MKTMFWSVFVLGFVACSAFGIGPVLKRMGGDWLSVPMVAGVVMGVAILVVAVMFATGVRPVWLPNDTVMLWTLVTLVLAKVAVGALSTVGVFVRA